MGESERIGGRGREWERDGGRRGRKETEEAGIYKHKKKQLTSEQSNAEESGQCYPTVSNTACAYERDASTMPNLQWLLHPHYTPAAVECSLTSLQLPLCVAEFYRQLEHSPTKNVICCSTCTLYIHYLCGPDNLAVWSQIIQWPQCTSPA